MAGEIRTDRLILRPLARTDIAALHAIFSDPVVMRYFGEVHDSIEVTETFVEDALRASPAEYVALRSGEVIGRVALWRLSEIGFLFRRDAWGQGLAGEAISALLPVFHAIGGPEIVADIDPRNRASRALLERHGFVVTGRAERTICIDGEWGDSLYLTRRA